MYLGNQHSATLKGSFPKRVTCGGCGHEYVYFIERVGTGSGFSALGLFGKGAERKATERAEKDLADQVENEVDVVPCPECGFIPEEMVDEARRLRFRWMKITGIVLIPLLVISLLMFLTTRQSPIDRGFNRVCLFLSILFFLGVLGFLLGRSLSNQNYDPNELAEDERIDQGRSRAVSLERFEEMLEEAEAKKAAKARKKKKRSADE